MNDRIGAKPVHTPEEMCAIIDALSKEDMDRLMLCALRLANSLEGTEARDLLHQAFIAATIGDRRCPKDVNPIAFLCNAMKSNLFNLRRKSKQTESVTGQEDDLDEANEENPELWLQRMETLKSVITQMQDVFGDDERPMLVFEGRADGMTREEIREMLGLDWTQYESLEKKIRRSISKRLPPRRAV